MMLIRKRDMNYLIIGVNSIGFICSLIVFVVGLLIAIKLNSRGTTLLVISFLWMLPIRFMLIISSIKVDFFINADILSALANGFWVFLLWAMLIFYRDMKLIAK